MQSESLKMLSGLFASLIMLQLCAAAEIRYKSEDCTKMHEPKLRRSCCNLPHDDEIIKKCELDLMTVKPDEPEHMKRKRSDKVALKLCIAECDFKAKGYLTAPYEINMTAVEADLKQRHSDDMEYVQLMQDGFHKCLDFARNKVKQIAWMRAPDDCDFFPAALLACATEKLYEHCPAKKWHATPPCEEMRTFLLKCDELEQ